MKKLIGNIIMSILLLGHLAACQNKRTMTAEEIAKAHAEEMNRPNGIWPTNKDENGDYYYSVSLNSFPGSLGENAGSVFITGKEEVRFLTMENDAWTTTTGAVLNDEYHPVPDSLYVCWFSVPEDKFYEGTFKMPTQFMKARFDEMWLAFGSATKARQSSKYERFEDLIVGVTPGGGVMVWMSSIFQQVEIGHYQAKEIQMDWTEFAAVNNFGEGTTRQQFVAGKKDDITLPVPFGKAENYREKFSWKCGVKGKANLEILSFELRLFNGEVESIYHDFNYGKNAFSERAVPKSLNVILQETNKKLFNFEILFDERDIFKAFHRICVDKNTEGKLVLVLNEENKISKIVLRNKDQEYVLNPEKISVSTGKYSPEIVSLKDY